MTLKAEKNSNNSRTNLIRFYREKKQLLSNKTSIHGKSNIINYFTCFRLSTQYLCHSTQNTIIIK